MHLNPTTRKAVEDNGEGKDEQSYNHKFFKSQAGQIYSHYYQTFCNDHLDMQHNKLEPKVYFLPNL
jgi:hypothetical protein